MSAANSTDLAPQLCSVASNPWGNGVGYVPYDGVLLDAGTLPGSWYLGYNTGKNAVHEVGHWWGLRAQLSEVSHAAIIWHLLLSHATAQL